MSQGGQRRYLSMAQTSGSSAGKNHGQPSAAAKQPPSNGTSKETAQKSQTAPPTGTPSSSMPAANGVGSNRGSSSRQRAPSQNSKQHATKFGRPNGPIQQQSNAIASAGPGAEAGRAGAQAGAAGLSTNFSQQQKQQRHSPITSARNVSATRPLSQERKPQPKQPYPPPAGAPAPATAGPSAPRLGPPGATIQPHHLRNGQDHPAQLNGQTASARPPTSIGAPVPAFSPQAPHSSEPPPPLPAEAVQAQAQAPLRDLLKVTFAAEHLQC